MTEWQAHCQRWSKGCGAEICPLAAEICFGRGSCPADVVIVGQAPGRVENAKGEPFRGPAGRLLDRILWAGIPPGINVAITNLVGCLPPEGEGRKADIPLPEDIKKCAPRLLEFIAIMRPRLIVCAGKLATDWLNSKRVKGIELPEPILMVDIIHPSAILQMPVAHQGLARDKAAVVIRQAIRQYLGVE